MDENRNANELNEALKGLWDSLTDEQKEKAKACKNMDELTKLAGKEGVELPDELLDDVAGGVIVKRGEGTPLERYSVYYNYGGRRHVGDFKTQGEAWKVANEVGADTRIMTEEQFRTQKSGC